MPLPRLTLHLRELPGDGPPLMLLHGLSVDGSIWQAVGRRLHPTFSLLAPDLRGHGYSGHPPAGYRATDYATDIVDLLESLAPIVSPVHLLGHSLGALAALGAAAQRPMLVGRLILEEPPLAGPSGLAPYLGAVLAAKRMSRDAVLAAVRQFQPELGTLVAEVQTDMWLRVADGALEAVIADPTRVFDVDGWLAQVPMPTLLIQADPAYGGHLSDRDADTAAAQLPRGEVVHFSGAGHVIHAQRVADFCAVVTKFLA